MVFAVKKQRDIFLYEREKKRIMSNLGLFIIPKTDFIWHKAVISLNLQKYFTFVTEL